MADKFTATPVKGQYTPGGTPDDNFVEVLAAIVSAADPTLLDGDLATLSLDAAGRLRVALSGLTNDLDDVHARLVEIRDTQGTTGDDLNDTTTVGRLARIVDLLTTAANDPLAIRLTDGTAFFGVSNPLPVRNVEETALDTATTRRYTSVDLAAGDSVDFDTLAMTGPSRVVEVTASASVRIKVEVFLTTTGSPTPVRDFLVDAFGYLSYQPPRVAGLDVAGGDVIRVRVTNLDDTASANVYASTTYVD